MTYKQYLKHYFKSFWKDEKYICIGLFGFFVIMFYGSFKWESSAFYGRQGLIISYFIGILIGILKITWDNYKLYLQIKNQHEIRNKKTMIF